MGESKLRKAEIEELKRNNPEDAARWRQTQQDRRDLVRGIRPASHDPRPVMAVARLVRAGFEEAKKTGSVDAPVTLYQSIISDTVDEESDVPGRVSQGMLALLPYVGQRDSSRSSAHCQAAQGAGWRCHRKGADNS